MDYLHADVDECQLEIYDCQQVCTNNDGSFTCSCRAGYELAADGITCNGIISNNGQDNNIHYFFLQRLSHVRQHHWYVMVNV